MGYYFFKNHFAMSFEGYQNVSGWLQIFWQLNQILQARPCGSFNMQPLFKKGVEKWFEKSGLRKVVDQKKR